MTWFQCGRSGIIYFLCSGRKRLVFSVRIEIIWVLVSGHRNRLAIRAGIKVDLISVMGSKFTWFLCAGSKLTLFQRRYRIDLFFVKIDIGFVCGPTITWFGFMDRN